MGTKLNSEEKERVKELYIGGKTSYEIADTFDVTYTTILRYLRNMGVERRKRGGRNKGEIVTDFDISEEEIVRLYKEGKSSGEIAKKAGCSAQPILKVLKKNEVPIRTSSQKVLSIEGNEDILAYLVGVYLGDMGKGDGNFCIKLGVTSEPFVDSVHSAFEKLGMNPFRSEEEPEMDNHSKVYITSVNSKELSRWLSSISESLDKLSNFLTNIQREKEFVRGFYESEGCARRHMPDGSPRYEVKMYNSDLNLLQFVQDIIEDWGFKTTIRSYTRKKREDPDRFIEISGSRKFKEEFLRFLDPVCKQGWI